MTILNRSITEIYCDLKHINFGWDAIKRDYKEGLPRTHFTENDVREFFEQLNFLTQVPLAQKTTLKTVEQRFVFYVYEGNEKFKMVVGFMKNNSTIVVTIH